MGRLGGTGLEAGLECCSRLGSLRYRLKIRPRRIGTNVSPALPYVDADRGEGAVVGATQRWTKRHPTCAYDGSGDGFSLLLLPPTANKIFEGYVGPGFSPTLGPEQVVVMDNLARIMRTKAHTPAIRLGGWTAKPPYVLPYSDNLIPGVCS